MSQEGRYRSHERWVQFLKVLAHNVIQDNLGRRVVLLAGGVDRVSEHPRVGDLGDRIDFDVPIGT